MIDPSAPSELELELAKLKAERLELEERRHEQEASLRIADEIELERIAIADEKAIGAAVAQHGTLGKRIAALKTPGLGVVIVKRPHHVAFRKWSDTYLGKLDGTVSNDAYEELVRPCLVHPDRLEFDRYCEEQPALLTRVANVCTKLAGMRGTELSGKS